MTENAHSAATDGIERLAFDGFPYGIVITERSGRLVRWNLASERLLGELASTLSAGSTRCCDLLGCREPSGPLEGVCLTEFAFGSGEPLPEVRVDLAGSPSGAAWVTAARLGGSAEYVALELRPGQPGDRRKRTTPHWTSGPQLRISALGRTRVQSREGEIGGSWLERRSGQVLKYLVCQRHRVVHTDEIAEAIWPGSTLNIGGTVRHFVHGLRGKLEPDREKRGISSFVISAQGGYTLDRSRVTVDADDFEQRVSAGLRAFGRGDLEEAGSLLRAGLDLYKGDFLADERYVDWVQEERDRLRDLAGRALAAVSDIELERGHVDEALALRGRLSDLRPFDSQTQREYLELLIAHGRRTDALRRYRMYRERLQREFDDTPEFDIAELTRAATGTA